MRKERSRFLRQQKPPGKPDKKRGKSRADNQQSINGYLFQQIAKSPCGEKDGSRQKQMPGFKTADTGGPYGATRKLRKHEVQDGSTANKAGQDSRHALKSQPA